MKLKNFSLSYGTQIFKAFSDESRVRILSLIFHNQKMCISDLELVLNFTQSKTSRHLIYLKNSKILTSEKIDNWVYYSIMEEVNDIVTRIFNFLHKDQVLQKDLEIYKVLYSNRELAKYKLENRKWITS